MSDWGKKPEAPTELFLDAEQRQTLVRFLHWFCYVENERGYLQRANQKEVSILKGILARLQADLITYYYP